MRGPKASCLELYLERFGEKEGKGDLGLRHTPLAVSGRVEAGRPGRRPEQRCWGENRAGPGGRNVCEAESSMGLGNLVPGKGFRRTRKVRLGWQDGC